MSWTEQPQQPRKSLWKRFMHWRSHPPQRKPEIDDTPNWISRATAKPEGRGLGYTGGENAT